MKVDSTLRGGLALLGLGVIAIAAIWYFFLRPPAANREPLVSAPISDAGANATVFEIMPGQSGARFTLGELLRGRPQTVVGLTGRIAGQIAVDFTDLAVTQVGVIQIDARGFYTDDIFRDESLHAWILNSREFPLITFAPTVIVGLPERIEWGETAVFTLAGDLTIRDTTKQVTFEATAVPLSPTRLKGRAAATISRADFGLVIPDVPKVANVDEDILLEIEFVATAVE